ncbi:MAG: protein-methionine-sulfoxide reductase catalytic subunit MsrP [Thiohalospira sp.]
MGMQVRPQSDFAVPEVEETGLTFVENALLKAREASRVSGLPALAGAAIPEGRFDDPEGPGRFSTDEDRTPYGDVTGYNNFFEFGSSKSDPKEYAESMPIDPWSIRVEGEAEETGDIPLEDFIRPHAFEERIYRLRCVEGWSMVIPWIGFPLTDVIRRLRPTSRAKYVEFTTLHDPENMRGQRRDTLDWPYVEGLRMDEASHPLTILAVGLYGEALPKQNGAPIRLVVPWKYGFKSIKSIVKIRFVEEQPTSSWMRSAPDEYGFYANVNPEVSHPRWSQRRERRIGEFGKRPTEKFNGYGEWVAGLYRGMDLEKHF